MKLTILICLSLFATLALGGNHLKIFEGRPFQRKPSSGMYLLEGLGLDELKNGQQIVAYGDVDNDKYTDIITLDDDETTLTVSLYSHQNFAFSPNVTITSSEKIVGVTTGDFNFDGRLDLLLTTLTKEDEPKAQVKYFFRAEKAPYYGEGNSKPDQVLSLADQSHPFVIDSNGNRHLDVLYVDKERFMQTYENEGLKTHPFHEAVSKADNCMDYGKVANYKFTAPHFNSFADLNGDCAADLLITSTDGKKKYLEVYLRHPVDSPVDTLFCLVDIVELNENITSISIADMSNDGKLDLVVVSQHDEAPLSINVIYNKLTSNPEKTCLLTNEAMINPFDKNAFNAVSSNSGVNQFTTLPSSYPVGTKLFTKDPIHRPGRVRIGDINIDGFPDLLFIIQKPTPKETKDEDKDETYGNIVLVMNQENTLVFNEENSALKNENKLFYKLMKEENQNDPNNIDLLTVPATSASFFDFHEKGKLGLWIVTRTKTTKSTLLGGFDFVTSENFILKALGLNGAKPSSKEKITEVLGGLYYGASIECTVTRVDGKNILTKVAQMPQSAYTSLDVPYMFLGLGRTNNYVENFAMGISKKDDDKNGKQQQNWTTIIPNSQLIVNPLVASTWTLDIYVSPIQEAFLISLVTGIILLILGIIIIYLHRQEKAEDIANQDRMIHIFG